MTRAVRWQLVGTCLLLGLTGCARIWFAEREPWRREAEISCLKSGAVKEGPSIAIIKAIEGPGVCGADYPLRVAALGDSAPIGFADEPMRPPGAIQSAPDYPRSPQVAPLYAGPNLCAAAGHGEGYAAIARSALAQHAARSLRAAARANPWTS